MPFSLSRVVNDPRVAQAFTIQRDAGAFVAGVWVPNPTTVPSYGVIQPSTPEEIDTVPEGDRVTGMFTFHSSNAIYHTGVDEGGIARTSDIIPWHGQNYRIVVVAPWQDFGYYKGIGARMSGA